MLRLSRYFLLVLMGLVGATGVLAADLRITDAWVRGTVPGQQVTGAYFSIEVSAPTHIVQARSPRAAKVQLHEFDSDAGPSRMRAVDRIPLAPGKAVALNPGSYHLMMIGLTSQIQPNENIPITLTIERDGKRSELSFVAKGRPLYGGATRQKP